MSTADDLRRLADLVERIEREAVAVREVSPFRTDDEALVAEVTVAIPADATQAAAEPAASTESDTASDGAPAGEDDTAGDASPTAESTPGESTANESAPATETDADDEPTPATETDGVPCRHPDCDESFDTQHGMRVHAAKVHAGDPDGGGPAYTDPAALRAAYEHGDTFAEMTDYLDVDVTPATVRRHMVSQGIHDPDERRGPDLSGVDADLDGDDTRDADEAAEADEGDEVDDAADSDEPSGADDRDGTRQAGDPEGTGDPDDPAATAETDGGPGTATGPDPASEAGPGPSQLPAPGEDLEATLDALAAELDGSVDLPDGVSLEDVVAAVRDGKTLRDVGQRLGLERDRTRALLDDLGLAGLVTGRLSKRPAGEDAAARIDARLRRLADEGTEEAH